MRILIAQINPIIGDFRGNTKKILDSMSLARQQQAELALFPELALTGYPPEDFLLHPTFIEDTYHALDKIVQASTGLVVIVGMPSKNHHGGEKPLCNSAAIISNGSLLGYQDKILLPTYDVFDERRYFEPSHQEVRLWDLCGKRVAIMICEDLWQHSSKLRWASYQRDPVAELQGLSPEIVLNLSASPYSIYKTATRFDVFSKAATTLHCPVVFCNQVGGNDSLIFDGFSGHMNDRGELVQHAKGFQEDALLIDTDESTTKQSFTIDPMSSLYNALVLGVRDYFFKHGFKKACIGLSGGIDSALVACIAVEALGKEHVLGITMPSRFSSTSSIEDAEALVKNLGIELKNISIEGPFESYLSLLGLEFKDMPFNVAEENLQARIRGMILMAFSNKMGYIVLGTGNKSEFAMGYSTLYGDMCGGLSVISDVSKTQVYELSRWINRHGILIPQNSIDKPPSAELRPNQKDTDSLPPYEIVDQVLSDYLEEYKTSEEISKSRGYSIELVRDLIRRIHQNEYKRRQGPLGLRVSEKAFSAGRRFPIVQGWV